MATDESQAFEAWELHARGYTVSKDAVDLEPPCGHLAKRALSLGSVDDGRRPGFWASLFGKGFASSPRSKRRSPLLPTKAPEPQELFECQIILPETFSVRIGLVTDLLRSLHNVSCPLSYELIGLPEGIVVQLTCGATDRTTVLEMLRAFFPEVRLREHQQFLENRWAEGPQFVSIVDFGLATNFYQQLRTGQSLDTDPLIGIIGALNELREDQLAVVQVLFTQAIKPWWNELYYFALADPGGKEVLPEIERKFSGFTYAVVIRVAALSGVEGAAFARAQAIGSAIVAATISDRNGLIPLNNDGYPGELHERAFIERRTHRTGMLLSAAELLTLFHLPSASVRSDRLKRQDTSTKASPLMTRSGELLLGSNEHDGEHLEVRLSTETRLRHTYVIGASGTGKSTLLLNMILQDLEDWRGVAVLDPHGDLIDDILARIPRHRLQDVVLFDPSDEEFPVGFNVLSAASDRERTLLASDLVGVFRRLSTSWGDQMNSILGNAILAFLEHPAGGTLLDLRRFLVDERFREKILVDVPDHEVVFFWGKEYPRLKGNPEAPLLTRLDGFLRHKTIRHMVAQDGARLNFRALMDEQKIFLGKLSQGAIGEENSHLLGSLLTAKIGQAAASRQDRAKDDRPPFHVYIDEFHNYITPSLAPLLSGVRKYGVGLVLANQDLQQIKSRSDDVASAVLANAYTRISFRVGEHDARALAEGFSTFESNDLQNLGIGQAIARVERKDFDFNLTTPEAPPEPDDAEDRRQTVIELSREQYAAAKEDVAVILAAKYPVPIAEEPTRSKPTPSDLSVHKLRERVGPTKESIAPQPVPEPLKEEKVPPAPVVTTQTLPGRGGQQHKYLQSLFKRMAEDRGFHVTIEKRVLDGAGHVDVALERHGLSVACEISVTTDPSHEVRNISKCLAAGFDYVVLVSSDKRVLTRAEKSLTEEIGGDDRVRFVTPESFLTFLGELDATQATTTSTIRGYRVKVTRKHLSPEEKRAREALLSDVIAKSLRRSKKTPPE